MATTFGSLFAPHPISGGKNGLETANTNTKIAVHLIANNSHLLIFIRFKAVVLSDSKKARVENLIFFGFLIFSRYISNGTATVSKANKKIGFRKLISLKVFTLDASLLETFSQNVC
tara:strand:- start:14292 stop:14639 length:348 start_codon:yes stop_codon:yes gene_type:complete